MRTFIASRTVECESSGTNTEKYKTEPGSTSDFNNWCGRTFSSRVTRPIFTLKGVTISFSYRTASHSTALGLSSLLLSLIFMTNLVLKKKYRFCTC